MKKRLLALLTALWLLCPLCAQAAARMPEYRGVVTDEADVLSKQLSADIKDYAEELADEADIGLHVVLVHFLDGMDAQSYANALFAKWNLDSDALLLLGAAGEDSFATAMGADAAKAIGQTNAENLMFTSSAFGALFQSQQYDAALSAYCAALNTLVEKQLDVRIRLNGRFGQTDAPAQTPASYASTLWDGVMNAISDTSNDYHQRHEASEREENGLTAGGWIMLIILVTIMTRKSKAQKRYRDQRKKSGCLGWLLGLGGISLLGKWLSGRRD